jgi:LPS-assembly protein
MHDAFQYYSNLNKAEIFSDLTKKYKNFTHVVQPSLVYRQPGHESQKPVTFDNLTEDQQALFAVGLPEQGYIFALGQYFYDENMNLKFYQRFLQNYFTDREYKLADMTNEMQYNWKKWRFYNLVTYSNEFKEIRDSASRITLSESEYHLGLSYTFKQNLGDQSIVVPANDVNFNFGYTYNQNIGVNGSLTYNIDDALSKQWSFGGSYKVDCWSMAASMRRAITPRPTGETVDDTFYIQLNFIPFATVGTK